MSEVGQRVSRKQCSIACCLTVIFICVFTSELTWVSITDTFATEGRGEEEG